MLPQNLKNNAFYALLKRIHTKLLEKKVNELYALYTQDIAKLHNMYRGKRLIIAGTGPSLNKTNLKLLRKQYVMGVNTFFKTGIPCELYVVGDVRVYQRLGKKIIHHPLGKLFLPSYAGIEYMTTTKVKYNEVYPIRATERLSYDLVDGIYPGDNSIISCLQIAYYLGFKQIGLIGCDCDYSGKEHFDDAKVDSKTNAYLTGDWSEIFLDYIGIHNHFRNNRRKIYNCTIGGKLEVFPRKSLKEFIK